ncbi:hypothetical protein VTJ83DRAFT_6431 [Remersonia thermophila]|uniref:Uncharacterized protein n=1 Tax=Remersonia thermophila TaxID=72144 RepID=A0ABR4D4P3_9PEZI
MATKGRKEKAPTSITTSTTNPSIVSLDPTTPLDPGPLISDILRTGYCVPGSVFLVEGVERSVRFGDEPGSSLDGARELDPGRHHRRGQSSHDPNRHKRPRRAVRLLLGDGELCIQAFVRSEMHCFVDSGKVYEGCYVRLDKFGLVAVDARSGGGGGGGGGSRKGEEGGGQVVYLDVRDMVTVGWNEKYMAMLGKDTKGSERLDVAEKTTRRLGGNHEADENARGEDVDEGEKQDGFREEDEFDEEVEEELMRLVDGHESARPTTTDAEPPPSRQQHRTEPDAKKKRDDDYLSDSDSAFETLLVSVERAAERRIALSLTPKPARADPGYQENQQHQARYRKQQQQNDHQQPRKQHVQPQPQQPAAQQHPAPIPKPRPWLPTSATTPLKLTTLSQIPHLPYRQNWMVNVLAVVSWISPCVEPSRIPPSYLQRTARLADPTIDFAPVNNDAPAKENGVLLTVHLGPETFHPAPGTVVLLLGVKNHHAEGGSLRKYVSDALAGGASWWVESPENQGEEKGLGWCRQRAAALREWWDSMQP